MHPDDEEALQGIDAAMFSGDAFEDGYARDRLRYFMHRWVQELDLIDKRLLFEDIANLRAQLKGLVG